MIENSLLLITFSKKETWIGKSLIKLREKLLKTKLNKWILNRKCCNRKTWENAWLRKPKWTNKLKNKKQPERKGMLFLSFKKISWTRRKEMRSRKLLIRLLLSKWLEIMKRTEDNVRYRQCKTRNKKLMLYKPKCVLLKRRSKTD